MQNERDTIFQPLTAIDYDIAGNSFRAYYDADNKLVCVVDFVTSDIKPNVLLVINPDGDRKWDDILLNDYGVDLETVRPKQNNKYQKLDIEYTGLSVYDNLIHAYSNGDDLTDVIGYLDAFHHDAAYRAAQERFDAAEMTANRARETIDRTMGVIAELQARLKVLRSKLALQRKSIGKEPTKKSASKILRTESQIDATSDKLMRAKKRLINAKRRLVVAEEDSEIARLILGNLGSVSGLPTKPLNTDIAVKQNPPVPMKQQDIQYTDTTLEADKMADNNEEVKPLFDKDPEIMDDEIAFKPINFGSDDSDKEDYQTTLQAEEQPETVFEPIPGIPEVPSVVENPVTQPVEFVPPTNFDSFNSSDNSSVDSSGALGVFTPTPIIEENTKEYETLTGWGNDSNDVINTGTSFGATGVSETLAEEFQMPVATAPVTPVNEYENTVAEIEPAPIDSGMRPVSPIAPDVPVVTSESDTNISISRARPSFAYYVLLILLIGLSIFTLWLYQKSTNGNLPELGAKSQVAETVDGTVFEEQVELEPIAPEIEPEPVIVEPEVIEPVIVEPEIVVPVVEPEVVAPVVEPEVIEPEPVIPVTEPEIVPDTTSASVIKSLRYTEDVQEPVVLETEEEILAKKPAYGVSQNEKMFVSEYDTEADMTDKLDFIAYDTGVLTYEEPDVITYESEIIEYNEPDVFVNDVFVEDVVEDDIEACADGQLPSPEGCCSGETYTYVGNGEYVCCVKSTGECFPPMR